MTQQMRVTEFFAMEAGEYLERLDALVSRRKAPDFDELYRIARALRGSALMANQQAIASAALAFEHLARAVMEGTRPWDEAIKQMAVRAVDDLKILLRKVGSWSDAEDAKAAGLVAELDKMSGRPSAPHRTPRQSGELDTGTRAFIGREGAAVASSLDQAAKALQQNPLAHDPLQRVLKMMQPLRGLAILNELPPMPDLLEGVERAIGEITGRTGPSERAALLFNAAAKAVSRAAREIASTGAADPDSPEAQEFAQRLGEVVAQDEAVPIETLYHEDAGPHIVEPGTTAARAGALGRLELVAQGEHLLRAADELERATSATQRELRTQALAATFRALAVAAGTPLQDAVAAFARVGRETVSRGGAVANTLPFAAQLRRAGELLSGSEAGDEGEIATRLAAISQALAALEAAPTGAAPAVTPAPRPRPRADSAATAAVRESHATPARARAPDATRTVRPPAPTPAVTPTPRRATTPAAPATRAAATPRQTPRTPDDIFGSWARYEQLLRERSRGKPAIEELLQSPAARAAAAAPPARATAGRPAPSGAAPPTAGGATPVVSIGDLVYRGKAAADRALTLRKEVEVALTDPTVNSALLRDLVEEIIDLVQLSIAERK